MAQGPSDTILVAIRITLRESKVRNLVGSVLQVRRLPVTAISPSLTL